MSHAFFEGEVYHKRYSPKIHQFTYPFYLLDIDLSSLSSLKNRLFSFEKTNLFSFKSKDHFGQDKSFLLNIEGLLKSFNLKKTEQMHFITLPRVLNFVFNPISVLILFKEKKPSSLLVEVHNYNGGRVVYQVALTSHKGLLYKGYVKKDMYVSPFLETKGVYHFSLKYKPHSLFLKVDLYEEEKIKLTALFKGKTKPFTTSTVLKLFFKNSFLTFWVVTRTLWQSFKLWKKGLTFYTPLPSDKQRRY